MEIKNCLVDEIRRLKRMNDKLEKKINEKEDSTFYKDEPELLTNNISAMCEIASTLSKLHVNGII